MNMKTLNIYNFITVVCLFLSYDLSAQESYKIAINGIELYSEMSYDDMVENFGSPDSYYVEDDGLVSFTNVYFYGNNTLTIEDNKLSGFSVEDNIWGVSIRFGDLVHNLYLGASITVFEDCEKLKLLEHPRFPETFWIIDNPLPNNAPDTYLMIECTNGKIASISYTEHL